MSNSVYGIALSGLNVARAGLSVTSNNIANVNTQGYSRQSLVQNQRESSFLGGNYFGQGVDVTSVRRSYSEIISQQEQRATSDAAYYQAKFDQVSRLDGVLGDDASGLSSALSDFFNSAQVLSTSPTDLSARQNFLSAASSLTSRFNSINGVMDELRAATNLKVEDTVQKINDAASQIKNLNVRITAANSQSFQSSPPNDLLDQRDDLIKELSAQIQLTSVPLEDGSINLFLANGQPLVVKGQDFPVTTSVDPTDPSNLLVGSNVADSTSPTGTTLVQFKPGTLGLGALSGYLEFREEELAEYQNTIGLMAANVAFTINDMQAEGIDLTTLQANLANPVANPLTGESRSFNSIFGFDGVDYQRSGSLTFDQNNTARRELFLNSVSKVAIDPNNSSDTRTINISQMDFNKLSPVDYEIRVEGGNVRYRELGSGDSFVDLPNTGAGPYAITDSQNNVLIEFSFNDSVTGVNAPVDGDAFTLYPVRDAAKNIRASNLRPDDVATAIAPNSVDPSSSKTDVFPGDNDNAARFAALQTQRNLLQGNGSSGVSLSDSFNQLVSKVGNKTREFEVASESRTAVLEQVQTIRDAASGVNMDEEAAQLIQYQQAYQASGRVISLSKEMFELVLGIFR